MDEMKFVFDIQRFADDLTDAFKVGSNTYSTLSDAITAAGSGGTVTLAKDITITSSLTINQAITFDLGGKTITADTSDGDVIKVTATSGTVTIKNGTIDGKNTKKSDGQDYGIVNISSGATVNLGEDGGSQKLKLTGTSSGNNNWLDGVYISGSSTGAVVINKGTTISIAHGNAILTATGTSGAKVTINDATIESTDSSALSLIIVQGTNPTLEINGGTISSSPNPSYNIVSYVDGVTNGTFKMTGGTITSNSTDTSQYYPTALGLSHNVTATITGGTIQAAAGAAIMTYGNLTIEGTDSAVKITGKDAIVTHTADSNNAEVTIGENVTITGTQSGIFNRNKSTFVIDGATITGGSLGAIFQSTQSGYGDSTHGSVQVKSGILKGTKNNLVVYHWAGDGSGKDSTFAKMTFGDESTGAVFSSNTAKATVSGSGDSAKYTITKLAENETVVCGGTNGTTVTEKETGTSGTDKNSVTVTADGVLSKVSVLTGSTNGIGITNSTAIDLTVTNVTSGTATKGVDVEFSANDTVSGIVIPTAVTAAEITVKGTDHLGSELSIAGSAVNVDATGGYKYSVTTNGHTIDLSDNTLTTAATAVTSYGKATIIKPPDGSSSAVTLTIGDNDYTYKQGANKGSYFYTKNTNVGFVFSETGDAITIEEGVAVDLYDGGHATTNKVATAATPTVTGSDYTVTKTADGYAVSVQDGATVTFGNKTFKFTLGESTEYATIAYKKDGTITSIYGGEYSATPAAFNEGDSIEVTGASATSSTSGALTFGADTAKVAVKSGSFTYAIDADGTSLTLKTDNDTVYIAGAATKIIPTQAGTKLLYGTSDNNAKTYEYKSAAGTAYFTATNGALDGFVFAAAGDSLVQPSSSALTKIGYIATGETTAQTLTAGTVAVDKYPYTLTYKDPAAETPTFEISNITPTTSSSAKVTVGTDVTFTFDKDTTADTNKVLFSASSGTPTATGFNATAGTVTLSANAAALMSSNETDSTSWFKINDTGVNIYSTGTVKFDAANNALQGIVGGDTITDAGSVTKIYYAGGSNEAEITFGSGDAEKVFTVKSTATNGVFFTVEKDKATGFTFTKLADELSGDLTNLKLYDGADDTEGFNAPTVVNSSGTAITTAKITKTNKSVGGTTTACFQLDVSGIDVGSVATFGDGGKVTFAGLESDNPPSVLFAKTGTLLQITGLKTAGDKISVEGTTGAMYVDGKTIEIVGTDGSGGFTYEMEAPATGTTAVAAIKDLTPGVQVKQSAGIDRLWTKAGENGTFQFGESPAFVIGGADNDSDGVMFDWSDTTKKVSGVGSVDEGESVTGALNGLSINGGEALNITGGTSNWFTFSGATISGLTDGDKVTAGDSVTSFVTKTDGTFTIFGTPLTTQNDDEVIFSTDGSKLTAISELSGTVIGNLTAEGLTINTKTLGVEGDTLIGATGNEDATSVIELHSLGAATAATEIKVADLGDISLIGADQNGSFTFGSVSFAIDNNGALETQFKFEGAAVTAIDGVDAGEKLAGDFSATGGVKINGGSTIEIANDKMISLVGSTALEGFSDGAEIKQADGFTSAKTDTEGKFTFKNGSISVAGDNNVTFVLDGKGNVTGINDVSEDAVISGNLDGIAINSGDKISIVGADSQPNPNLIYKNGTISGVVAGDTIYLADSANSILATGAGDFTFVNNGKEQKLSTDADKLDFAVTSAATGVVATAVDKLDAGKVLGGALSSLENVNGTKFSIANDSDFSVVGAATGLGQILGLTGGVTVTDAGGASKAVTDGKDGLFTFGKAGFSVAGAAGEMTFGLAENAVNAIDGITGTTSVTGALGGLKFNSASAALEVTGAGEQLTVYSAEEVLNLAGLKDGANVAATGGVSNFLTDGNGKFTILETAMEIKDDSDGVTFATDGTKLSAITGLSGTAVGGFSGIKVNNVDIVVTNDSEIAVVGNDAAVTEVNQLGGAADDKIEVTADSATKFGVDKLGQFNFNGSASFAVDGDNTTETKFTLEGTKVTAIDNVDEKEILGGDFAEEILVDGKAVQVNNGGNAIQLAGTQILGLSSGAEVVKAEGFTEAVTTGDGTFKFANGEFAIAGDSNGATFKLKEGKVVGITGLEGQITGDLNGLTINGGSSFSVVNGENPNTMLTYDATKNELSGIANGDKVVSANGASAAVASSTEDPFNVEFANGTFFISGTSSVKFDVTNKNVAKAVDGLAEGATIGGAIHELDKINGGSFDVEDKDLNFSVVGGADNKVGQIIGITGDAVVNNAGGASIAKTDGAGTFKFGSQSSFILAGGSEITFALNAEGVVTGISDVDPTETVTGALNGLTFNNGDEALVITGSSSNWYTFSGASIAGIQAGDAVEQAGGATDFVTKESGEFNILGTSMAIENDDDGVTFKTAEKALTAIAGLDGTATGNFTGGLSVNTEAVQVTGDNDIKVTSDGEIVTAIAGVSGTVDLTEIGSATQVSADGDGTFNFVKAGQSFGLTNSDGVVFGIGASGVTAIDEFGDEEILTGKFDNGIAVNGAEVKVTNSEAIVLAGASISGLNDGAIVEATGEGKYTEAVTNGEGVFKFNNGEFAISGDSNGVTFQLDEEGNVIGVTDLDGAVSGNLNDVLINDNPPAVNVIGVSGPNTNLIYADGILSGLVDGDSVYGADHATTVQASASGTFTFMDKEQSFTTTDNDGIDFVVEAGTTNVTAVDLLNANETLTGAIGSLSNVNGVEFDVQGDDDFGVVGGDGKLNEIIGLSDGVIVGSAGGASVAKTDGTDGTFTFGASAFTVANSEGEITFGLDENAAVTEINDIGNASVTGELSGLTIDGEALEISGGTSNWFTVSGQSVAGLTNGDAVVQTAGKTDFISKESGSFDILGVPMAIENDDNGVMFKTDGETLTGIAELEGTAIGDFTGGLSVNTEKVLVDGDPEIQVTSDGEVVTAIAGVSGTVDLTQIGSATQVSADGDGEFTFEGDQVFTTENSDGVVFGLGESGVTAINEVGDEEIVTGDFANGIEVNGAEVKVTNSEAIQLAGAAISGLKDGAVVEATGEYTTAITDGDGTFKFANGAFSIADEDGVAFGVENAAVTAINGLNGKAEGNFDNVAVNGAAIKVSGDSSIGLVGVGGSAVTEIFNLGNNAVISSADGVTLATTNEEGKFTFADGRTINIAGDSSVAFELDGEGNLVSIDELDDAATVSGNLNGLDFSGSGSAIDVRDNEKLWYSAGTLSGVVNGNTVISADGATTVRTAGDGTYDFNGDVYVVNGDEDGIVDFVLDGDKKVTGIEELDENATVEGALNGKTVNNGEAINVVGDNSFGAVAGVGGLSKLVGLGGTSVAVKAADGATVFETDTDGKFKFFDDNEFTVADEGGVVFTTADEKVSAIDEVVGTVEGNFADGVAVNNNSVQVTDADDVVKVTATAEKVSRIDDVDGDAVVISSGGASFVGTKTQGTFQFESAQIFTTAGDDTVTFALDGNGSVTGVSDFDLTGTLEFDNATKALKVNAENISVATTTNASLSLANGSINYVKGVTESISGLTNATVEATGATKNVNGTDLVVSDGDDNYKVIVTNGAVSGLSDVNGNATVSVAAALTIGTRNTSDASAFAVGTENFNFNDTLDGAFNMHTDENGKLTGISNFEGAAVLESPAAAVVSVNDQDLIIASGSPSVTLSTDGASLGVDGLQSGDAIFGADTNTSIAVAGSSSIVEGQGTKVSINSDGYELLNDADGIVMNGNREAVGLDENGSLKVEQAGTYNVNGTPDLQADKDDKIVGDADGAAYIYDPNAVVVGPGTPISEIESMLGLPEYASQLGGDDLDGTDPLVEDPLTKAQTDAMFGPSSTTDLNGPIEIFASNDTATPQEMNLADSKFTKKVHMYRGPQSVAFNNDGGNLALVDSRAQGAKQIAFGNGGDVAVVDMAAASGNSTDLIGGTGDDSVIVRGSAPVNFDMTSGGADKVGTFAKANARINLTNYDPTTNAGIMVYERNARDFAQAIANKLISFGDGVLNIGSGSNQSKVTFGGHTDAVGGMLVNLFNPYGIKQAVGFTNSAGGEVDASASTEPVLLVGNNDGAKTGGSVLKGGSGNDTAEAGGGDEIDLGEGNNVVNLENNVNRSGANVILGRGRTVINNFNGTFNLEHGDVIGGIDLATANVYFDGTNVVMESANGSYGVIANAKPAKSISYDLAESADLVESADETTVSLKTADGDYTNVMFAEGNEINKTAIAKTGGVVDVQLDEDARADYYIGDNSGMTFYGYNGNVNINLAAQSGIIDGTAVNVEGFNKIAAGTGNTTLQGSDANETLVAGTGNDSLYGNGGKNLLVGHSATGKDGQTTFFVLGHAGGAANTIQSFTFVNDNSWTNNSVTADIIDVDTNTNLVKSAEISGNDVVLTVQNRNSDVTESVVIEGAVGKNIFVADRASGNAAIGQVNTDTLTYDKFANFYIATGKNATVKVASDLDVARVYLGNNTVTGTVFQGDIHVIDAVGTNAKAELAGNDYDNTIFAGNGDTSLWGGNRGDDMLVGGTGKNTFVYNYGNGNDEIVGANNGDVVDLNTLTLDQIASTEITTDGVVLNFTDGGKLTVNGTADVNYQVAGATYAVDKSTGTWARKA